LLHLRISQTSTKRPGSYSRDLTYLIQQIKERAQTITIWMTMASQTACTSIPKLEPNSSLEMNNLQAQSNILKNFKFIMLSTVKEIQARIISKVIQDSLTSVLELVTGTQLLESKLLREYSNFSSLFTSS
jgi:hypothetical protein